MSARPEFNAPVKKSTIGKANIGNFRAPNQSDPLEFHVRNTSRMDSNLNRPQPASHKKLLTYLDDEDDYDSDPVNWTRSFLDTEENKMDREWKKRMDREEESEDSSTMPSLTNSVLDVSHRQHTDDRKIGNMLMPDDIDSTDGQEN